MIFALLLLSTGAFPARASEPAALKGAADAYIAKQCPAKAARTRARPPRSSFIVPIARTPKSVEAAAAKEIARLGYANPISRFKIWGIRGGQGHAPWILADVFVHDGDYALEQILVLAVAQERDAYYLLQQTSRCRPDGDPSCNTPGAPVTASIAPFDLVELDGEGKDAVVTYERSTSGLLLGMTAYSIEDDGWKKLSDGCLSDYDVP